MSEPKDTEHPEEHDGDYGEPGDEYRQGCCFPDRCLMPGMHNRSECHDVEMMEALHAEIEALSPEADTEHASDHWSGAELAAHYEGKGWPMIGRVRGIAYGVGGEPVGDDGELRVTLDNGPHDELSPKRERILIHHMLGWPALKDTSAQSRPLGLLYVAPDTARALAQYLVEAADWVDGGMEMPSHPFTRLAEFPQYVFGCDHEVWIMTVHGDVFVVIAHEQNGTGEGDTEGWVVEMTKGLDGRWEISGGAAKLAANTRATTPAALEALLNLHGVPT